MDDKNQPQILKGRGLLVSDAENMMKPSKVLGALVALLKLATAPL